MMQTTVVIRNLRNKILLNQVSDKLTSYNIIYAYFSISTAPPQQQHLAPNNNTITFSTNAQPQQQQPKELIDFFASLENEKVNIFYNPVIQQQPQQQQQQQQQQSMFTPPMITTQPTGHNPFRTNTVDTSMQQLMAPPQQSTSSILPSINNVQQVNPFRASTMPQMSTSSPTPYFNNNNNNNMNSFNNALVLQQQPQPQQTLSSSNNPFALSTQQQQQSFPQTIMVASPNTLNNNNPFSNTANKQQQLQPWGSSIF
jgi:hypothetical protein